MIVTIHQPNFAPWTGFFDKMSKSDVFVLLDTVPFTKGGFQNRVKVKGNNGAQWLTVPVQTKGKLGQLTSDVETNELRPWREDHIRTLETFYRKAPHGQEMIEQIRESYASADDLLVNLCVDIIERAHRHYGLETRLIRASELDVEGSSSELLARIVEACDGDVYLSGPSGRNYLDSAPFDERNIAVTYHEFTPEPYPQQDGDFVGGLSILDHWANCGPSPWWT